MKNIFIATHFTQKGTKSVAAILAILLVLFTISPVAAADTYEYEQKDAAIVSGGIGGEDLDAELSEKRLELKRVENSITNLRNDITSKKSEISSLTSQLGTLDSRIELIQLQLRATQLDIEATSGEISQTEEEIIAKTKEIEQQKVTMGKVIRRLYMEKDTNIISIVVEAQSFSELVERTEYLSRVRAQLKDTLDKLDTLKQELEDRKQELEAKMDQLSQLREDQAFEEVALEDQKYAKIKLVEYTQGQESEYQNRLAQARAEEQAITNEVVRLVQEQARRRRAQEGVAGRPGRETIVNEGGFTYPLAGSNRISIIGGDFMDPAYGLGFPHTGVDLAASQGSAVFAAGAGVVLAAHDSGNAGLSYIAIDHGNGLITKYLHVSAIYVVAGDIVNAGDTIGLSGGSPGTRGAGLFTTGAHLHFEINDYAGKALNPHNYLSFLPPLF